MSSDWTRCRTIVRAQNQCQCYRSLQKEKGLRTRVFLKYRTVGSRSSEMYEVCCILYLKRIWSSWSGTSQWIKCPPKGCGFESRRLRKEKSRYFMISYNQKWRRGSIGRTLGSITKKSKDLIGIAQAKCLILGGFRPTKSYPSPQGEDGLMDVCTLNKR